ncbi:3'-5' exonuclease [Patescibacteria group bacterium]|nr:3'-5' exonuclease [Patescibacteria group bacterium]
MENNISNLLKLDRPLIIFDLETTGLAVSFDRIIELAYIKVWPDGRMQKDDILINPEISIPKESSDVHGIKNEDVEHAPVFKNLAEDLLAVFSGCIYSGFNVIRFDLPMLKNEFARAGVAFEYSKDEILDSSVIFSTKEPRTLAAAYKFYCDKEHGNAHRALADVEVTLEVLVGQLNKYKDMQNWENVKNIHTESDSRFVDSERKFYWRDGVAYFAFSKFKDQPLENIAKLEPGFMNWILNADFTEETKDIIRKAQIGEFPQKNV